MEKVSVDRLAPEPLCLGFFDEKPTSVKLGRVGVDGERLARTYLKAHLTQIPHVKTK